MHIMANIGIIGSGNIGAALTRLLTKAGHQVAVSNSRGPESLAALAQETGARAASVTDVVQTSTIVIVSIPLTHIPHLPADLFQQGPAGQIVIDTSNYYPQHRDGLIAEIEAGMPESAWVEKHLGRPVIKAFNSILADRLASVGRPGTVTGRVALAVAGDDASDKATVIALLGDIGFEGVDAGTIADSWRQQPGTPGYLHDFEAAGVRRALADASPVRTPEWKATPNSPGTFDAPA
jgi:predicted dinucleotide-binding enzyme